MKFSAADVDLSAVDKCVVPAGGKTVVKTGIGLQVPTGYAAASSMELGLAAP